jgi:hypothetical protein
MILVVGLKRQIVPTNVSCPLARDRVCAWAWSKYITVRCLFILAGLIWLCFTNMCWITEKTRGKTREMN